MPARLLAQRVREMTPLFCQPPRSRRLRSQRFDPPRDRLGSNRPAIATVQIAMQTKERNEEKRKRRGATRKKEVGDHQQARRPSLGTLSAALLAA